MRAILTLAVDNVRLTGGICRQYRPQKIPANGHFYCLAGDAGGILRGFCIARSEQYTPSRYPVGGPELSLEPGALQSRLEPL